MRWTKEGTLTLDKDERKAKEGRPKIEVRKSRRWTTGMLRMKTEREEETRRSWSINNRITTDLSGMLRKWRRQGMLTYQGMKNTLRRNKRGMSREKVEKK